MPSLPRWLCRLQPAAAIRAILVASLIAPCLAGAAPIARHLPGELSADEILEGQTLWAERPSPPLRYDATGLRAARLVAPPAPGVHPRLLVTPDELPELRQRLRTTQAGRAMLATLRARVGASIGKEGTWEHRVFGQLAAGEVAAARAELEGRPKPSSPTGHYQPHIPYALVMAAFDALVSEDAVRGVATARAIANYTRVIEPAVIAALEGPLNDDVWRVKVSGSHTGVGAESQGVRELVGYHLLGYAYDFAHPYLTEADRSQVRQFIARLTAGRVWLGARLPAHWRNWNWVMVGLSQPLLSLAIEGEDGHDPRVYRLGVQLARDYLTHALSPAGASTEAVGYTQFGLVWGNPFLVAAARRGENLLAHPHLRAMPAWYFQTMEPYAPDWAPKRDAVDAEQAARHLPAAWSSTGDGGDEGPSLGTLMMWKRHFPDDPTVDLLLRTVVNPARGQPFGGTFHVIEPLIWASDPGGAGAGAASGLAEVAAAAAAPLTWFDPARGALIARSDWSAGATVMRFECRTDSHTASHEHADRGGFLLTADGRRWARDGFRSIESRHHNVVLIDGLGQGYWPGPGRWLGQVDGGWAVLAACDAKNAYDWFWPKQIRTESPETFERFRFARWANYGREAQAFQRVHPPGEGERDPSPAVAAVFAGFTAGDPRFWDEDAWPVRFPHNPVRHAFRTVLFVREPQPYLLVVDDLQKDDRERLYEWLLFPGGDAEVVSITGDDIMLRAGEGPAGRRLLVRALDLAGPARPQDYPARPSHRLEVFEKKDTLGPEGRSFGLDRRLVVASRAVAPRFKLLVFPHRPGVPLPRTTWNAERSAVTLELGGQRDELHFAPGEDGRTRVSIVRSGAAITLP